MRSCSYRCHQGGRLGREGCHEPASSHHRLRALRGRQFCLPSQRLWPSLGGSPFTLPFSPLSWGSRSSPPLLPFQPRHHQQTRNGSLTHCEWHCAESLPQHSPGTPNCPRALGIPSSHLCSASSYEGLLSHCLGHAEEQVEEERQLGREEREKELPGCPLLCLGKDGAHRRLPWLPLWDLPLGDWLASSREWKGALLLGCSSGFSHEYPNGRGLLLAHRAQAGLPHLECRGSRVQPHVGAGIERGDDVGGQKLLCCSGGEENDPTHLSEKRGGSSEFVDLKRLLPPHASPLGRLSSLPTHNPSPAKLPLTRGTFPSGPRHRWISSSELWWRMSCTTPCGHKRGE